MRHFGCGEALISENEEVVQRREEVGAGFELIHGLSSKTS